MWYNLFQKLEANVLKNEIMIINSGIMTPFIADLTSNTAAHFTHCLYFPWPYGAQRSMMQLAKYYMLNHQIRCQCTKLCVALDLSSKCKFLIKLTFLWLTIFNSTSSRKALLACVTFWNGRLSFLIATLSPVVESNAELKHISKNTWSTSGRCCYEMCWAKHPERVGTGFFKTLKYIREIKRPSCLCASHIKCYRFQPKHTGFTEN